MSEMNPISILQTSTLPAPAEAFLKKRFDLIQLPSSPSERQTVLVNAGAKIRGIAGSGKGRVDEPLLTHLPALEIISVTSAGLDGIDIDAVGRRSIPIFNTSDILANDVADIALWLVLGTTRNLVAADKFVRSGGWRKAGFPLGKTIAGMNIGILGLGHIGQSIALRLDILGANVGYCGRSRKPDVKYPHFHEVQALASWCDILIVSCPATAETTGMVDADVLKALGRDGILINIARGSIVDETALVNAVTRGEIYGAGLDVFSQEPNVPEELTESDRTILLPHIGSASERTRERMWQSMIESLLSHFKLPDADWRDGEKTTQGDSA